MKSPVCPACEKPCKRATLDKNSGVCPSCKEGFVKRHSVSNRQGTQSEHSSRFISQDAAFVGNHLEPIIDFNLEEVFSHEEVDAEIPEHMQEYAIEIRKERARAIAKFCLRVLEFGRTRDTFWQAAHAYAFAAQLHPEQDKSGEEIAEKFNLTKQGFFKEVNRIRDTLNLPRIAGAKRNEARITYKESATKSHAKRNHNHRKPVRTFAQRFKEAYSFGRGADSQTPALNAA